MYMNDVPDDVFLTPDILEISTATTTARQSTPTAAGSDQSGERSIHTHTHAHTHTHTHTTIPTTNVYHMPNLSDCFGNNIISSPARAYAASALPPAYLRAIGSSRTTGESSASASASASASQQRTTRETTPLAPPIPPQPKPQQQHHHHDLIDLSQGDEPGLVSSASTVFPDPDVYGITQHSQSQIQSLLYSQQHPELNRKKQPSRAEQYYREQHRARLALLVEQRQHEKEEEERKKKHEADAKPQRMAEKSKSSASDRSQSKKKRYHLRVSLMLVAADRLAVDSHPEDQRVVTIVRSVDSSAFDSQLQLWTCSLSAHSALISRFNNLTSEVTEVIIEDIDRKYLLQSESQKQTLVKPDDKTSQLLSMQKIPRKLARWLYPFQREGVEFVVKHDGRALIGDEMGLGKTVQALAVCAYYRTSWPVLIVCPSSLRLNWRNEIERWLPEVHGRQISVIMSGKDRLMLKGPRFGTQFVVISYDLVHRFAWSIKKANFEISIVDESHLIKNDKAKRTQILAPILERAKYCVLLTGTPALSKPIELFRQINCLRPGLFGTLQQFGTRYCGGKKGRFGMEYKGAERLHELHYLLKQHVMIRRTKNEVLTELRPKTRTAVMVALDDPTVARDVQQLKEATRAMIDTAGGTRDAVDISSSSSSSSSSAAPFSAQSRSLLFELYQKTGAAKVSAVIQYISDLLESGCKFLVFAHHLSVLNPIEEFLQKNRYGYFRLDGATKAADRQAGVEQFQTRAECRVALLSITAGGTGITLTAASTVVFAELTWNPASLLQAEDRVHRIGQPNAVNVHYLLARHSLDECMWPMLVNKLKVIGKALDGTADEIEFGEIRGDNSGLGLKQANNNTLAVWMEKSKQRQQEKEKERQQREAQRTAQWKDAIEVGDDDTEDTESSFFPSYRDLDDDDPNESLIFISDDDEESVANSLLGKNWDDYDKEDGFIVDDDEVEYDENEAEEEEEDDAASDSSYALSDEHAEDEEDDDEYGEDDGEAEYVPLHHKQSTTSRRMHRVLADDDEEDSEQYQTEQSSSSSSSSSSVSASASSSSVKSSSSSFSRSALYASMFGIDEQQIEEEEKRAAAAAKAARTTHRKKTPSRANNGSTNTRGTRDSADVHMNIAEESTADADATADNGEQKKRDEATQQLMSMGYPTHIINRVVHTIDATHSGQDYINLLLDRVAKESQQEEPVSSKHQAVNNPQEQKAHQSQNEERQAPSPADRLKMQHSFTASVSSASEYPLSMTTVVPSHTSKRVLACVSVPPDDDDSNSPCDGLISSSRLVSRKRRMIEIDSEEEDKIVADDPENDDVSAVEWLEE